MINRFRSLFAPRAAPLPEATIPDGQRVFAIGDIHGRLDLFLQLAEMIEADDRARGAADTTVILLGDLIDRGPDSAGVIRAARSWQAQRRVRIIAGNHEQMLVESMTSKETLRQFLRYGGRETLLSYGLSREEYESSTLDDLLERLPSLIPAEDIDYIGEMENSVQVGDYLFVHAGIRPGVPLADQQTSDLRWIRGEFLDDPADHGQVVVHGHTITDEVVVLPNRIGIDTGAYASGALTALGLEGGELWFLSTQPPSPAIAEAGFRTAS